MPRFAPDRRNPRDELAEAAKALTPARAVGVSAALPAHCSSFR